MIPERSLGSFQSLPEPVCARVGKAGKNTANDCAPQNNVRIVLPSRHYVLAGLGLAFVTVIPLLRSRGRDGRFDVKLVRS